MNGRRERLPSVKDIVPMKIYHAAIEFFSHQVFLLHFNESMLYDSDQTLVIFMD